MTMKTTTFFKAILADAKGATAVEYGLIVALIVIAILAALKNVANENTGLWATVRENIDVVM